MNRAILGGIFT